VAGILTLPAARVRTLLTASIRAVPTAGMLTVRTASIRTLPAAGMLTVRTAGIPAVPTAGILPLVAACVLGLLTACGEPPRPLSTSPPYSAASSAPSAASSVGLPPTPAVPTAGGYPTQTYPTYVTPAATPPRPTTTTPSPTPAHAGRCTGQPTGAEILAEVTGMQGIPSEPLRIFEGPFCSGTWSFTTLEVSGMSEDQVDPLMVIATGKGSTLEVLAAGSDVCTDPVRLGAPPGIRVLACGS
jgi:hypothetical protein